MAKLAFVALILTIVCSLVSTLDVYASKQGPVAEEEINFPRDTNTCTEKLVKLSYYVHHFGLNHPNTTAYEVARASITNTSPTSFGSVRVIDDQVTEGPDPTSPQLGRCQGLVTRSDLSVPAIALNVDIYFTAGKYAGSTLSILGRYEVYGRKPEVVVAGGTGSFRFARGYSIMNTTFPEGKDSAIMGFDVYITYIPVDDVYIYKM